MNSNLRKFNDITQLFLNEMGNLLKLESLFRVVRNHDSFICISPFDNRPEVWKVLVYFDRRTGHSESPLHEVFGEEPLKELKDN